MKCVLCSTVIVYHIMVGCYIYQQYFLKIMSKSKGASNPVSRKCVPVHMEKSANDSAVFKLSLKSY